MTDTALALLTDLYQLTMLQSYSDWQMQETAVFEFFVRKMPKEREFLIACGLDQVLNYLENLHFSPEDIDYLQKSGRFRKEFLHSLSEFRFTGDVHAMPEGTVFFPDEPILRVTAPLSQAQFVETRIVNILQFQTLIASKAGRMVLLAPKKALIDYGLRRAHGSEAGILAARASYIAGFTGTATVLAGKLFGIPIFGTMAHSYIQAHDSESLAFKHFAESHPLNTILLLDTYDTVHGAHKAVKLATQLRKKGIEIRGVRLDSGDMITLSKEVRKILDAGGLQSVKIFASGSIDEYALMEFVSNKAPVDGFGIGSKMTTSADVPYLDCAYKLVEYAGIGRRKLSKGKATLPGRKQIFRQYDQHSRMTGDLLALAGEDWQRESLVHQVMADGKRMHPLQPVGDIQAYTRKQLSTLPSPCRDLARNYPVNVSRQLQELADKVTQRMKSCSELE